MSIKDNTKKTIAEGLKRLLMQKTIDKISTREICSVCEISRQTFYYHFKDKYALLAWIYINDCANAYKDKVKEDKKIFSRQRIECTLNVVLKNKDFYKKALDDKSQNSLQSYIHSHCVDVIETYYKNYLNVSKLDNELHHAIVFYSHGCVSYTLDWINKGFNVSTEEFAKILYDNLPDILINMGDCYCGIEK